MNEIRLSGVVGVEITADGVAAQLKGMAGDLTIVINSPGGSFFQGAQVYNELKQYPGRKVVIMGSLVCSAASYISCVGDEIIASGNTSFMIHEVYSGAEGTARELAEHAKQIEKLNGIIAARLAERSGKSEKEVRALMAAETWYYGQEIVDAGFADRLEGTGQAVAERGEAVAQAQQAFRAAAMFSGPGESFRLPQRAPREPDEPAPGSYAAENARRPPLIINFNDDEPADDDEPVDDYDGMVVSKDRKYEKIEGTIRTYEY